MSTTHPNHNSNPPQQTPQLTTQNLRLHTTAAQTTNPFSQTRSSSIVSSTHSTTTTLVNELQNLNPNYTTTHSSYPIPPLQPSPSKMVPANPTPQRKSRSNSGRIIDGGRHSNEWLFGGFSFRETFRGLLTERKGRRG